MDLSISSLMFLFKTKYIPLRFESAFDSDIQMTELDHYITEILARKLGGKKENWSIAERFLL